MKLRSSLSLFEAAYPAPLFAAELARQLERECNAATLEILGR